MKEWLSPTRCTVFLPKPCLQFCNVEVMVQSGDLDRFTYHGTESRADLNYSRLQTEIMNVSKCRIRLILNNDAFSQISTWNLTLSVITPLVYLIFKLHWERNASWLCAGNFYRASAAPWPQASISLPGMKAYHPASNLMSTSGTSKHQ